MRLRSTLLLAACLSAPLTGCRPDATDFLDSAKTSLFERQPEEALGHYRRALEALRRDESPSAEILKARALKGAGDTYFLHQRKIPEAVSLYRQLIQECPESPEALEARKTLAGVLQNHYRDLRGAITQLTEAIARNPPESAELNYEVAQLYFELQDYAQAEVEALRLTQRYETSAFVDDALLLRAQAISLIEGRESEAIRAFQELGTRMSESELVPHALFELGKLRSKLGDEEKAIEEWIAALATHPRPELVQDAIARARRRLAQAQTVDLKIGNLAAAFDRPVHRPSPTRVKKSKTSLEAVGGSPEEEKHPEGD